MTFLSLRLHRLAALALLALPVLLPAEIVDSAPGGFTVRGVMILQAPTSDAYQKFVRNVGDWWDSGHTFSRDAKNLSIDDKPGGCFCEKWANGGVQHLQVVYAAPGKVLAMRGGMGPLMSLAVTGGLEIQFAAAESGTKVTYTYSVGGYIPKGADSWAGPVDGMLAGTFARFQNYVNTGSPDGKDGK